MKIETVRFGSIEVDEKLIFEFVRPIIGYDEAHKFVLVENGQNNLFRWLQAVDAPEIAFPVSMPSLFNIEYQFEIDDEYVEILGLNSQNDLLTFNIVNIPNSNPKDSTINLLGPIIINVNNNKGMQLVLSGTDYQARQRLFPKDVSSIKEVGV